jgi:hypothetical protein
METVYIYYINEEEKNKIRDHIRKNRHLGMFEKEVTEQFISVDVARCSLAFNLGYAMCDLLKNR